MGNGGMDDREREYKTKGGGGEEEKIWKEVLKMLVQPIAVLLWYMG